MELIMGGSVVGNLHARTQSRRDAGLLFTSISESTTSFAECSAVEPSTVIVSIGRV
jgi:hypothetical protein